MTGRPIVLLAWAAIATWALPAPAATFSRDGDRLTLSGTIGDSDAVVFETQLNNDVHVVSLNSTGGYIDEAMQIGKAVRAPRTDTTRPPSPLSGSPGRMSLCSRR